jgi:hypothetical protein
MKEGKLIKRGRWFDEFEVENFTPNPHGFSSFSRYSSCGTSCLATVTGLHPEKIDKHLPKNQRYWSCNSFARFLTKQKYHVIPITRNLVTAHTTIVYPIKPLHVLVAGLDLCTEAETGEKEASWFVIYRNKIWHNFMVEDLHPLEFVNHPIQCMYMIYHPQWKRIDKNGKKTKI